MLSDSVEQLSNLQFLGDLPSSNIFVMPARAGSGTSEGTALMEIVYDLAPGARLGFSTAQGGQAAFASNILGLSTAGCDVMVDDIFYLLEPTLQDGPIAATIDEVTAKGIIYFSSAGNGGNLNDGTSGVWEGNYVQHPNQICANVPGIGLFCSTTLHDFSGFPGNLITVDPPFFITLQ